MELIHSTMLPERAAAILDAATDAGRDQAILAAGFSSTAPLQLQYPPFRFEQRRMRIDWRLLHGVDVNKLVSGIRCTHSCVQGGDLHDACVRFRGIAAITTIQHSLATAMSTPPWPLQIRDTDLDALEQLVSCITWGDLEAEGPGQVDPSSTAKLFRLAQLLLEYLLYVQDNLQHANSILERCRLV